MQPRQASPEQPVQPSRLAQQPRGRAQQRLPELSGPALVMMRGAGEGRRIPVSPEGVTLGHIDQLGPPFTTDELVSRKHASVRCLGDGSVEVTDLGSTNGTYINGRKVVAPSLLNASDVLRVGQIELRLDVAGAPAVSGADTAIAGDMWLVEQTRPPSSSLWALTSDRLTIGRDPSSDIVVDDSGVSRHHADLVRRGRTWSITDEGSANGTRVDGASVRQRTLRSGSRIEVGNVELVLRSPVADSHDHREDAPRYDVGVQVGNVHNVAGNQANYYQESNLRFIASRRGLARRLMVSGLLLFLIGNAIGIIGVLSFDSSIFSSINSPSFSPPSIPGYFIPLVGLSSIMTLLGVGLFIFGLITRIGAKRRAREVGVDW
jgi:pSer/pThr/pTyr-binding forkhead associated (FHA) protein